jgi:RimJ/RimL family protein N-acetyltransferase
MFARTERLLLRPAWIEDAPALTRIADDHSVARNLTHLPYPYRLDAAEDFVRAQQTSTCPAMLILRRTHGAPQLIGCIGLHVDEAGVHQLGYWLGRQYWGLGYATEAGRAVIAIARDALRLKRIEAGHFFDNPGSGRVLRKLGFKPTGEVAMQHSLARGGEVPSLLYAQDFAADEQRQCDGILEEACQMAA